MTGDFVDRHPWPVGIAATLTVVEGFQVVIMSARDDAAVLVIDLALAVVVTFVVFLLIGLAVEALVRALAKAIRR